MSERGFILIPRTFFKSEIWNEKPAWWSKVWVHLLQTANWDDGAKLKRGQLLTSYKRIHSACKLHQENVKPASIKNLTQHLKETRQITTHKTRRGIVITICKYDSYQNLSSYINPTQNPTQNPTGTRLEPDEDIKRQEIQETKKPPLPPSPEILVVFENWNALGIIRHRVVTKTMESAIRSKLKTFGLADILETIRNYETVISGDEYFFKYKWALVDFLKRGYEKFRTENNPFENYLTNKKQTAVAKLNFEARHPELASFNDNHDSGGNVIDITLSDLTRSPESDFLRLVNGDGRVKKESFTG